MRLLSDNRHADGLCTYTGPTEFVGTLHERNADNLVVNMKGRMKKIPRDKVVQVRLIQDQIKLR